MNKQEYAEYESAVQAFFDREGITNLSSGHIECPECGKSEVWLETGSCCGVDKECYDESSFSWARCDCCDRPLGGDRYHATGYNPKTKEVQEYEVCTDCIYYAEYGQLDDMTMMDMTA